MTQKSLFSPAIVDDVPEITPEELAPFKDKVKLIDVRRPDEFTGPLSHIPGAQLMTLGPELDAFLADTAKDEELVFVCRSGARSGRATLQARSLGFEKSVNLQGGMILWNEKKLPVS